MRTLIVLFLAIALNASADYTEFYINNAGGGNTNSGHTADATPTFSAQNGFWTNYTGYGVFFKAGMTLTAVTNGAWAAVYTNDSTATAFVGIITNVDDPGDFIFVKTVEASSGNPPTQDDLNGKTHITVGGAWFGPKSGTADATSVATNTFPTALVMHRMTNGTGMIPRVNIKGGTTYAVTNALTISGPGPCVWQGYTNTVGDLGKFTIDGTWAGPYFDLMTITASYVVLADAILANNGSSSSVKVGLSWASGLFGVGSRITVHDVSSHGFACSGAILSECEAYACNKGNASDTCGFYQYFLALNCISHDNVTANASGFRISGGANMVNCTSESNGKNGLVIANNSHGSVIGCNFYGNAASGIDMSVNGGVNILIQNCLFVTNGAYAINSSGTTVSNRNGFIYNCGFGRGTMANVSGDFAANLGGIQNVTGSHTIFADDASPWVDAPNGDFRLNLTAAKAAGRQAFTQTAASYSGTVGYPDLGAAQTASTNAAAAGGAYTFAQ